MNYLTYTSDGLNGKYQTRIRFEKNWNADSQTWTNETSGWGSGTCSTSVKIPKGYFFIYIGSATGASYNYSGFYACSTSVTDVKGQVTGTSLSQYTINYNANGGSGAPAAQTKDWGVSLTLSSTKPTKAAVLTRVEQAQACSYQKQLLMPTTEI